MSETAVLLGVFALGLVSGYLLRGASRISMSADEVAWGWGYKRRHRRRSRRGVPVLGATAAVVESSSPKARTVLKTDTNSSQQRASRWLFLSGLTTGAAFATGYLMLGSRLDALDWIGVSLVQAMPIFVRLPHWLS